MKVVIKGREVDVIIERKRSNKNTYLRVKEDLNIYITTNYFIKEKEIKKIIDENTSSIEKMILRQERKKISEENFSYLGKKYDIIYLNDANLILGSDKVLIPKEFDLDKWYLKEAKKIFSEELDKIYNIFPRKIPYPSLTIRKMKSRWGVCNVKTKRVTINLELIKKDIKYLDYVIAHELSHLIHPNHSKDFWNLVEEVIPNYKTIRKEMKNYE